MIVPAYRVRATLREAVDSLLRQTFRNLEVLVIDDACPDQCTEVLFGIDDPRLGIFRLQRNAGLVGARNAALALSRAPFVALLDGDDVSRPNRIARQTAAFEGRPDVGLVGCLVNGIDMQSRLITRGIDDWGLDDEALKPLMLFANPFPSAVHMLRRSAIPEAVSGRSTPRTMTMAADVARHHAVVLVREALVDYRKSPGGIMHTKFDQVSRDTLLIQGRLLPEVGMGKAECDPLLMSALMHCSAQPLGALSVERMLALRQWMQDLERANAHSGRYSSDALGRAIARAWELVLLHATRVEGLRFRASLCPRSSCVSRSAGAVPGPRARRRARRAEYVQTPAGNSPVREQGMFDVSSPSGSDVAASEGSAPSSLSNTLRRGAAISTGVLVFTQLVVLVQTLILARLLSPEEVGWFAAGTVLCTFLLTFAEGGMSNALVQRQDRVDDVAATVFWATLLTGVGWAAVTVVSAPLMAWVFGSETVGLITAASAGSIILHALTYVPDALMQRRFDFRQRLIVQPVTTVTFALVSVALCANGLGVWGLVIGFYRSTVAWLIATWTLAGWRPGGPGRALLRAVA